MNIPAIMALFLCFILLISGVVLSVTRFKSASTILIVLASIAAVAFGVIFFEAITGSYWKAILILTFAVAVGVPVCYGAVKLQDKIMKKTWS